MMEQTAGADNQQPNEIDRAWWAAFVDGEGYFGVNVAERKDREQLQVAPRVTVVNTDQRVLQWMHDELHRCGVGVHLKQRRKARKRHQAQWELNIIGYKRCEAFLPIVLPYLKCKRLNAALLYAFVKYRRSVWNVNGERKGYDGIELDVWNTLKALNHEYGPTTRREALRLIGELAERMG